MATENFDGDQTNIFTKFPCLFKYMVSPKGNPQPSPHRALANSNRYMESKIHSLIVIPDWLKL